MSTRSIICKEQPDGSYKGIYCHWDGYLAYNGAMLLDHYSDTEKLNSLLELGDISSLRENVDPDPALPHDFENSQEDVTIAYGRDRGEKKIEARGITLEQAKKSWCEYMYIFGRDGKWRYYALSQKDPKLFDVEADLNTEYAEMGIKRPVEVYGFMPQSQIDSIKAEQAQLEKSEAVK